MPIRHLATTSYEAGGEPPGSEGTSSAGIQGESDMTLDQKAVQSGAVAVVFFTALSGVTAIATALLPLFMAH